MRNIFNLVVTLGRQLIELVFTAIAFTVGFVGILLWHLIRASVGGVKLVFGLFQADVIMLLLSGLLLWPVWNYAAVAAFPFFEKIDFSQAVGLIVIAHLLRSKHYVAPKVESSIQLGGGTTGHNQGNPQVPSGGTGRGQTCSRAGSAR